MRAAVKLAGEGQSAPLAATPATGRSRNSITPVLSRLLTCRDVLFFNSLEADVIPFRGEIFHPVAGRWGPKLGPGLIRAFAGTIEKGPELPSRQGHRQMEER
jgi:hypothetical protein